MEFTDKHGRSSQRIMARIRDKYTGSSPGSSSARFVRPRQRRGEEEEKEKTDCFFSGDEPREIAATHDTRLRIYELLHYCVDAKYLHSRAR